MGVLTTTYSVPASVADLVIQKPDLISDLFYPEYREDTSVEPEDVGLSSEWKPQQYGFDKSWEDFLSLYWKTGKKELRIALENEVTEVDHDGRAWIRYWAPQQLKRIKDLMVTFDSTDFFDQCKQVENLTDWDGEPMEEYLIELLTNMHESFGIFIGDSASKGDFMFAITE